MTQRKRTAGERYLRRLRRRFAGADVDRGRGRVVMLVNAALGPDSRVIKQARSMSGRGWEVIVLPVADHASGVNDLGTAQVQVVPPVHEVITHPELMRSLRWRDPLAYRTPRRANDRVAVHRMRELDAWCRLDQLALAERDRRSLAVLRTRVVARVWKARLAISERRLARTDKALERRRAFDSALDRSITGLRKARGARAWRSLWPAFWNHEIAYGPVIDVLDPDIIHANDFAMLAVGARARLRSHVRGTRAALLWDAREFVPGMSPWNSHPRWHPAAIAIEQEYAPAADEVVTVSDRLAEMLVETHDLTETPAVVMNAPDTSETSRQCPTDVRTECGLGAGTPLIVYSGAAAPQRGLEILIDVLPLLPEAHLALVVDAPHQKQRPEYTESLAARATAAEVSDRVHILPYVPSEEVVSFLSTADLGVFPGLPFLNHTISLITKFLEYSHARLPIVVSELKTMADTVRATGQGEVFEHGDVQGLAAAVTRIVGDPARYRRAYDDPDLMHSWSWEAQAEVLDKVYARCMERASLD